LFNDPTGKFKSIADVHGNYCGWDARSGIPNDDLDRFCLKHDNAYAGPEYADQRLSDWNFFNPDLDNVINRINTDLNLISEGLKHAFHNPGEGLTVAIGGAIFLGMESTLIVIGNLLRLFGL
jgi:hypothetical protein